MKIHKKNIFFLFCFLGGGGVKLSGWGGQGGCEWRSEALVKIKKKNIFFWGGGRVRGRIGGCQGGLGTEN